ncbi:MULTISPECIES: TolC family protein [Enterobacterales]|uniref:TolC family protein n=1 Tax=Enterobacterales TaxID=91347 RepID=UPI002ED8046E
MRRVIFGYCVSLFVVCHVDAASINHLDELIAPMAPVVAGSGGNKITTSPETLQLLDKLEREQRQTGPEYRPHPLPLPEPVKVPAYFTGQADEEDIASATCNLTSHETISTFSQALTQAICSDPEIRTLALGLRTYWLDYKSSQSSWMPEINLLLGASSEEDNYSQERRGTLTQRDRRYDAGLELNWLLFDFGKREALIGQKENIWLSSQYQALSQFQDFIIQFSQVYYQVIASQAILSAAKENESIARKTWDITQNKYRSGVGVLGDALQAENALLSATQYRIQKEGEYEKAVGQLSSAMNLSFSDRLKPRDQLAIPSDAQMMQLKPLLSEAEKHHPLILAAQKNISAAENQVEQAQRDYLPSVALKASANQNDSSLDQGTYMINKTDTLFVGVTVTVPIFSGLRRYRQLQSANTQLVRSRQEFQDVTRNVALSVWNAWQALNSANRNFELISQRLATAKRAYSIANGRYLTGVGTIIELLNTQQQLSNAEIDEANIRMDWYIQRLSLLSSIGKLSLQ